MACPWPPSKNQAFPFKITAIVASSSLSPPCPSSQTPFSSLPLIPASGPSRGPACYRLLHLGTLIRVLVTECEHTPALVLSPGDLAYSRCSVSAESGWDLLGTRRWYQDDSYLTDAAIEVPGGEGICPRTPRWEVAEAKGGGLCLAVITHRRPPRVG